MEPEVDLRYVLSNVMVTGQLADKPTRGQSSRGLDNWRTGQFAEMFDSKFGVYNSSKCYFGQITLFIVNVIIRPQGRIFDIAQRYFPSRHVTRSRDFRCKREMFVCHSGLFVFRCCFVGVKIFVN